MLITHVQIRLIYVRVKAGHPPRYGVHLIYQMRDKGLLKSQSSFNLFVCRSSDRQVSKSESHFVREGFPQGRPNGRHESNAVTSIAGRSRVATTGL